MLWKNRHHRHLVDIFLVLVLILSLFVVTSHGVCNWVDQNSLSSFKLSVSSAVPLNWSVSVDCCSWEGVNCDDSDRVIALVLPSRGLAGIIPPSLRNLTGLTHLDLSHNCLSSHLPDGFFWFLKSLKLVDLSSNCLSGPLPAAIELPSTIQTVNFSGNHLNGTLKSSLFSSSSRLETFDASNNSFSGFLPSSICIFSPGILSFDFSNNDFVGSIPPAFGHCSNLQFLRAGFNKLSGEIPHDIYNLSALQELYLAGNKLSGQINEAIVNLVNLKILDLYGNNFTGTIPREMGRLHSLEKLHLHINQLNGSIPASLTNCSNLVSLNLRVNFLRGELSSYDFSRFVQLKSIDLGNNLFTGKLPSSLFSCKKLTAIRLASNSLNGEILPDILNLQSLSFLSISNNSLTNIQSAIKILTGCKNLSVIILSKNFDKESLPGDESMADSELGFHHLQVLGLGGCNLTGSIPSWLSKLQTLQVLDLSYNNITGFIPGWLGTFHNLFYLDLSYNQLSGAFPIDLTTLHRLAFQKKSDLVELSYFELPVFVQPNNVSSSNLQYNQLMNLPSALYLGHNSINGVIPSEIGRLKFIVALDLSSNSFSGNIPEAISNLTNLEKLDLSGNQLTGEIPQSLRNLNFLSYFNVSHNNLHGPIPTGGQFDTFPGSSFEGNPWLCGPVLQRPCSNLAEPGGHKQSRSGTRKKTVIIASLLIFSGVFTTTLFLYFFFSKRRIMADSEKKDDFAAVSHLPGISPKNPRNLVTLFPNNRKKIEPLTIADLLAATDNFNQSNIIGCGGFGLVYKATLIDGTSLAIKKLSEDTGLMEREFRAEVEALSTAQHDNLVTLQGYCIHDDYRLLLYSYMENGSLDYWLHEKPGGASQLSWPTRLKIARGTSLGVAYMHNICEPHIVHRDLKSSNILLDHEFEAHVADFGLARLILPYHTHVTTELVGTLGYIPPEYSQSWIATLRGDVYSFGVVLLELLTGRRPVELFRPITSRELVKWVQEMRSHGRQEEIFDPSLGFIQFEEEMLQVLDVACLCVNSNPIKRPTITQVVDWLHHHTTS